MFSLLSIRFLLIYFWIRVDHVNLTHRKDHLALLQWRLGEGVPSPCRYNPMSTIFLGSMDFLLSSVDQMLLEVTAGLRRNFRHYLPHLIWCGLRASAETVEPKVEQPRTTLTFRSKATLLAGDDYYSLYSSCILKTDLLFIDLKFIQVHELRIAFLLTCPKQFCISDSGRR